MTPLTRQMKKKLDKNRGIRFDGRDDNMYLKYTASSGCSLGR